MPRRERDDPSEAAVRDRPADHRAPAETDRRRLCRAGRPAASAVARSHADRPPDQCGHFPLRILGASVGAGGLHPRPGVRRRPALGEHFLKAIQPFVWRRSLDFGVIEEVREISARIRDHFAQGARLGPGFDLKRGRGGIREVEFFAQIQQMIHGGRDPSVRASATLDALSALHRAPADRPAKMPTALADAYRLLADDRAPGADGRRRPDPLASARPGRSR